MPDIVKFLRNNYKTLDNLFGQFKSIMVHNNYDDWYKKYNGIVDNFFVHEQKPEKLRSYKSGVKNPYAIMPNMYDNPTGKVTGFYHFDTYTNPGIKDTPEYKQYSAADEQDSSKYINFYDYLNQKSKETGVNLLGNFIQKYNVNPTVKDLSSYIGSFSNEPLDDGTTRSSVQNQINQRIANINKGYDQFIRSMYSDLGSSGNMGRSLANNLMLNANADKLPFFNYKQKYDPMKIVTVNGNLVKVNMRTNQYDILGKFGEGMNLNKSQLFPINENVYYYNTEHGLIPTDIPLEDYQAMLDKDKPDYSRGGYHFGGGYEKSVPNYFFQDAQDWLSFLNSKGEVQPELNNKIHAWGNYFAQNYPFETANKNWVQAGLDKYVKLEHYYK